MTLSSICLVLRTTLNRNRGILVRQDILMIYYSSLLMQSLKSFHLVNFENYFELEPGVLIVCRDSDELLLTARC